MRRVSPPTPPTGGTSKGLGSKMDFVVHVQNERLAQALKLLEQGEQGLRVTTLKLEKRLNEHARAAVATGVIDFGSNLLAHRRG